jgi:hypothetical protein
MVKRPRTRWLPRVPMPKPTRRFRTRRHELDRKVKHKGRREAADR